MKNIFRDLFRRNLERFILIFFFSALSQVDEFQQELTQRVTDRVGLINQNSTKDDVQRWLASKKISSKYITIFFYQNKILEYKFLFLRLAQNLYGMNGEELFQLSKNTLDQFTNETESAKIYALISQQKQLSGVRIFFLINNYYYYIFTSLSSIEIEIRLTDHRF